MSTLADLIRANQLGELEPEEVAGLLLVHLNAQSEAERDSLTLKKVSFLLVRDALPDETYRRVPLMKIMAEAWTWLVAQGLIAPHPDRELPFFFVARRGRKLLTTEDVAVFRRGAILGKEHLHAKIAAAAWTPFLRGDYETAVFAAFKEVEVAVRIAGSFADTEIGVQLMRRAFALQGGPLTDPALPAGEQQAMSDVFAGSIGLFKNPSSHRHVAFSDPAEAAELIGTASYLMRLVDARRAGGTD